MRLCARDSLGACDRWSAAAWRARAVRRLRPRLDLRVRRAGLRPEAHAV